MSEQQRIEEDVMNHQVVSAAGSAAVMHAAADQCRYGTTFFSYNTYMGDILGAYLPLPTLCCCCCG